MKHYCHECGNETSHDGRCPNCGAPLRSQLPPGTEQDKPDYISPKNIIEWLG